MSELDKIQGNLIKAIVVIGKRYHTSPLLQALECPAISSTIELNSVRLFRPWFFYYSFYGSADRLFWGFGKKIKLLLHTFFILADSRS